MQLRDDVVGMEQAILGPTEVWEASGHLENFADPLVECANCHTRHREDHLRDLQLGSETAEGTLQCPSCGKQELGDPRNFNLMFKTHIGPIEDAKNVVWLRPETAQGIFVNFMQVQASMRRKLPFGIAQTGKSFRNEITPGNFIFRTREFEQMEMEYFVKPGTDEQCHQHWIDERFQWYLDLGMREENLRLREHDPDELSHYSKRTVDIEYKYPWGWGELEGIANRGNFDLSQHAKFSGQDLSYFDPETQERYIPYVIDPAAGATRALLAFLIDAYREEEAPNAKGGVDKRVVLRLHKQLAPYKVAVLPLSKHENLRPLAKQVAQTLRAGYSIDYDETGSIGKRYRRHDEIGTPYAVTVDFDSLEDKAVTIRDRDSMKQERVGIDALSDWLRPRLSW
ncbi:glycine--tRNA ligase [soil metagenome]